MRDFAQRVTAHNSVIFHPISKNEVPWYSDRDRDLSVDHPQSRFWPILRDYYFGRGAYGYGISKTPQKIGPLGGPTPNGSTKISKSRFPKNLGKCKFWPHLYAWGWLFTARYPCIVSAWLSTINTRNIMYMTIQGFITLPIIEYTSIWIVVNVTLWQGAKHRFRWSVLRSIQ